MTVHWLQAGGWVTWAVLAQLMVGLLVGGIALALAIAARSKPAVRTFAVVAGFGALMCALVPVATGVLGWWLSMERVEGALLNADPEQRDLLKAYGEREAAVPAYIGGGTGTCCVLGAMGIVGLAMGARREGDEKI